MLGSVRRFSWTRDPVNHYLTARINYVARELMNGSRASACVHTIQNKNPLQIHSGKDMGSLAS